VVVVVSQVGQYAVLWEIFMEDFQSGHCILARTSRLKAVKNHFEPLNWKYSEAASLHVVKELFEHLRGDMMAKLKADPSQDLMVDDQQLAFTIDMNAAYSLMYGGGLDRLSNSHRKFGLKPLVPDDIDELDKVPSEKQMLDVLTPLGGFVDPFPSAKRRVLPSALVSSSTPAAAAAAPPVTRAAAPAPAPAVATPLQVFAKRDAVEWGKRLAAKYNQGVRPSWWAWPCASKADEFSITFSDYDGNVRSMDPEIAAKLQLPLAVAIHACEHEPFFFDRYNSSTGLKSSGQTVKYEVDLTEVAKYGVAGEAKQRNTVTQSELFLKVTMTQAFAGSAKDLFSKGKRKAKGDIITFTTNATWLKGFPGLADHWESSAESFTVDNVQVLHFGHLKEVHGSLRFSLQKSKWALDLVSKEFSPGMVKDAFLIQNEQLSSDFDMHSDRMKNREAMIRKIPGYENAVMKTNLMWHGVRNTGRPDECFGTLVNIMQNGFNQMYHTTKDFTQAVMGNGIYFSNTTTYQLRDMPTFCEAQLPVDSGISGGKERYLLGCLVNSLTWSFADYSVKYPNEMDTVYDKDNKPTCLVHEARSDGHYPRMGPRFVTHQHHAIPVFLVLLK
jgi:hypothetical protein